MTSWGGILCGKNMGIVTCIGILIGSSYPAAADSIDNLGPGDNSIESMRVIEPEQGSNSSDKLRIIVELDDKAVIEQAANQGLSLRQLSVTRPTPCAAACSPDRLL